MKVVIVVDGHISWPIAILRQLQQLRSERYKRTLIFHQHFHLHTVHQMDFFRKNNDAVLNCSRIAHAF